MSDGKFKGKPKFYDLQREFDSYHKAYWKLQEDSFNSLNPEIYKNQYNAFVAGFETVLFTGTYYNAFAGKWELTQEAQKFMSENFKEDKT